MVRDNCPCVSAEVGMKFVQELEAAEMEKTKMLRSLEVGNNDEEGSCGNAGTMDALPMNTNVWVSGDKNFEQEVLAADTRPQELITDCEATPRPRSIQRGDGTAWREWRWRRRD